MNKMILKVFTIIIVIISQQQGIASETYNALQELKINKKTALGATIFALAAAGLLYSRYNKTTAPRVMKLQDAITTMKLEFDRFKKACAELNQKNNDKTIVGLYSNTKSLLKALYTTLTTVNELKQLFQKNASLNEKDYIFIDKIKFVEQGSTNTRQERLSVRLMNIDKFIEKVETIEKDFRNTEEKKRGTYRLTQMVSSILQDVKKLSPW